MRYAMQIVGILVAGSGVVAAVAGRQDWAILTSVGVLCIVVGNLFAVIDMQREILALHSTDPLNQQITDAYVETLKAQAAKNNSDGEKQ